jgi:hypothetical protein
MMDEPRRAQELRRVGEDLRQQEREGLDAALFILVMILAAIVTAALIGNGERVLAVGVVMMFCAWRVVAAIGQLRTENRRIGGRIVQALEKEKPADGEGKEPT